MNCCGSLIRWSGIAQAEGFYAGLPPNAEYMHALELCISDANKPLLLANANFIPYLIDGLLLDPGHPRAGLPEHAKAWLQTMHTECFAQLAVFPPGRDALLADPSVVKVLQVVAQGGISDEGRQHAQNALAALRVEEVEATRSEGGSEGCEGPKHVMLSYQWSSQSVIVRINASLRRRGYLVWIDLEMCVTLADRVTTSFRRALIVWLTTTRRVAVRMKGSTMDAMSEAIEGADVMCVAAARSSSMTVAAAAAPGSASSAVACVLLGANCVHSGSNSSRLITPSPLMSHWPNMSIASAT